MSEITTILIVDDEPAGRVARNRLARPVYHGVCRTGAARGVPPHAHHRDAERAEKANGLRASVSSVSLW